MDKRGQFYLILAVIISISFFAITIPQNNVKESFLIQDFNDISNNYVQESPKVANYAIYDGKNVNFVLNDYSSKFLDMVRKRNPSLELIYIYNNGTNVTVKSYSFNPVEVETGGLTQTLLGSNQETINNINLKVAGQDFVQQVPLQIKNFGDSFSQADLSGYGQVVLNIGGTLHNFDISSGNGPAINVFITSKNGNTVQVFQTSGSGKFPVTI